MSDLAAEVASRQWYHTIDLPGGVVTPGLFDIRPVLDRYGLPASLAGQKVLDVASFDGYFAFEFERRGGDVTCIDIPDVKDQDWPEPMRRSGAADKEKQRTNFDFVHGVLGSKVTRKLVSVYDIADAGIGPFDFVFVGSLLLHLRDPIGALMAVRKVCSGTIMIAEEASRSLDLLYPTKPMAKLRSMTPWMTWWIPNRAALSEYLTAAGYLDVERKATFTIPFRAQRGGVRHTVLTARSPGD
ncbi:MAG TPA: class I SAM-dependent methyltransferase [Mycobacteriales bacterium]|nr:class I SAM-dependent methyltransferase [Mycobacteriales bacterium]